jgi:hypothetical protein
MVPSLHLILLVLAFLLVLIRSFGVTAPRVDLGWLGLAVGLLSLLVV